MRKSLTIGGTAGEVQIQGVDPTTGALELRAKTQVRSFVNDVLIVPLSSGG